MSWNVQRGLYMSVRTSFQKRCLFLSAVKFKDNHNDHTVKSPLRKASTPIGRLDKEWGGAKEEMKPQTGPVDEEKAYEPFPDGKNPVTGEIDGPKGPEPTRYGDWERKGRTIDF